MSIYDNLWNWDSPGVKAALEHKCEICGAKPGEGCTNLVGGYPLSDRRVHIYRIPVEAI